jgi:hypothetical protein
MLFFLFGGPHSGPDPAFWCAKNMRSIDGAKLELAAEAALTNGASVTEEQLSHYMAGGFQRFKCVTGGHYSIGRISEEPRCSVHGSLGEALGETSPKRFAQ